MTAEEQPIGCTPAEQNFRERLAWITSLTRDALRSSERDDLVLEPRYAPEAASREREMVRKEQAYCAFLTFELHEQPDELQLKITAPEDANADTLFRPFTHS
jgi:hypothetical protein